MQSPSLINRMQMLSRSSFGADLIEFISIRAESALNDLAEVTEVPAIYQAQGRISALRALASDFEHLKQAEDVEDDPNGALVPIPSKNPLGD